MPKYAAVEFLDEDLEDFVLLPNSVFDPQQDNEMPENAELPADISESFNNANSAITDGFIDSTAMAHVQ